MIAQTLQRSSKSLSSGRKMPSPQAMQSRSIAIHVASVAVYGAKPAVRVAQELFSCIGMVHLIRNCVFFFTTLEFFCWQLDLDKGCDHLIWHPVFSETDSLPYACLQHLPLIGPRKDVVQRRSEVSGAQFFTSLFGNSLLGPWIY